MRNALKLLALAAFLVVAVAVGHQLRQAGLLQPTRLREALEALGGWEPVAFIALNLLGVVLAVPAGLFTLLAGFLFGPVWGLAFNALGATLGAAVAFVIARGLGREAIQARLKGRLREIDDGLSTGGLGYVVFLRVVPLLPFVWVSYAAGVTSMSFGTFTLGTFVGILPLAAVYTYLGAAAAELSLPKIAVAVGLLVVAAAATLAYKLRKRPAVAT